MGERDFRKVVKSAIESIGKELDIQIDPTDIQTIHLHEVVQCLRRSYYDRVDPQDIKRKGFNDLLAGLLRKLEYGSEPKEFDIEDISLRGQVDMIIDETIILFRSATTTELENPLGSDVLYLNACMWIYNKFDGIVVYISEDGKETTFSLTRTKKMFEEIVRRVRVLNDLLKEEKLPILEPSTECSECQYYARCYMKQKSSKQVSLSEILGMNNKK